MHELNPKLNSVVSRIEVISLTIVFLLFLSINLATGDRLPTVYIDEVSFTDPAANLYFGNGFTSTAWFAQTKDEFWAAHGPLYSALLYLWMLLFGFSPIAVRSLNYVLIVISMFLLWLAIVRLNLVPSTRRRIALVLLLLLAYGMTFNYRTGRLDCIAILLFTASALVYSIQSTRVRYLLLFCISILFPMAGLQMVAYAAIFCGLLLIYLRRSFLKECVFLSSGTAVGAICLYILYSLNGVVDGFVATITPMSPLLGKDLASNFATRSLSRKISLGFPFVLAKDISYPFLLTSALAVTAYKWATGQFRLSSVLSFGVAVAFCVPLLMFLVYQYPAYYSWMTFIPLSVCVFSGMQDLSRDRSKHLSIRTAIGCLFIAGLVGLPLHLVLAAYDWNDRDYTPVEALAERHVVKDNWVLSDYSAYYAVKKRAGVVFLPHYLNIMSSHEKEKLSVLIIHPRGLETVRRRVGGKWYDTGDSISPEVEGLFGFSVRTGLLTLSTYKLSVFKRVNNFYQPYSSSEAPIKSLDRMQYN
jgi:hypothetical protein